MCGLALAVLFRFQRASGPGCSHGNQEEAAGPPASLTTQQDRTCLGECWPLWGLDNGKFPEETRQVAAVC